MALGCGLGSALLAWVLAGTGPLRALEMKTYDLRFVLRGPVAPPQNVMLILVDQRTEKELPEPRVFWGPHYAALMRGAATGGAKALGLDIFFDTSVAKWEPDHDRVLAAAFLESAPVLPTALAYTTILGPRERLLPIYMAASTMDALAYANVTLDPEDGFVRRQELLDRDNTVDALATRVAALTLQASPSKFAPDRRAVIMGDRTIPLDADGFMRVHYWGPANTFNSVSMIDVVRAVERKNETQLRRWFEGKTVLVGSTDPIDALQTPFYAGAEARLMPGIEVHANTLATILEQRYLRDVSRAVAVLLVLAGAAIAAVLVFQLGFPIAPVALALVIVGYFWLALKMQVAGTVLPVVPPVLATLIAGFASYGAYSLTEGRQRKLLQDVFGRYVSGQVAHELLTYGEVPLGGTCQQVTVLFSDLRNYTSYCEGRDPQVVVGELNEYFADMSAEIKAHHGMINKFIGDGIMAIWGAPVPHRDDPLRAVQCAFRMVLRNDEFNRRREQQGLPPLVIGIGLHTGEAVVGNIGAPEKMEYTAIGETVNVAARIESENKTFKSKLLISEATYQQVASGVIAEPAGHAQMKGVGRAILLYKVIEIKGGAV